MHTKRSLLTRAFRKLYIAIRCNNYKKTDRLYQGIHKRGDTEGRLTEDMATEDISKLIRG